MDPEGVREVFYAFHGSAPNYGVRNALGDLPFLVRQQDSRFVGLHLPLTRALPKRIDIQLQQYVGLHRYDMLVLAGIDAVVFDADDLHNLLAYVEAGGGLLLLGGSSSFDKAQRGWGPLREALPATIAPLHEPRRPRVPKKAPPTADRFAVSPAQPHPITQGLSGPLGRVGPLQPIEAKPHATTLATANNQPLIVAGEHLKGRVVMIASYPSGGAEDMFVSAGYADLLGQAMMWLMGRFDDLKIERCDADNSPMLLGQSKTISLGLTQGADPSAAKATISRADPGWLSVGREPQFVDETSQELTVTEQTVDFQFSPSEPGLWRVQLDVAGEGWANRRVAHITAGTSLELGLSLRQNGYVSAPGRTLPRELTAKESVSATLKVIDFDDHEVWRREGVEVGVIEIPLPQLELGHYEVIAQATQEEARLRFYVTQPQDKVPFTLCATTRPGSTEEQSRWLYEYFRDRGFNAHSRPSNYGQYLAQREGHDIWIEYAGASLLEGHRGFGEEGSSPTRPCVRSPEYDEALREKLWDKFSEAAAVPRMVGLEIFDEPHFYRPHVCHCRYCQAEFSRRYGYELPTWDQAIAAGDHRTRDYFEFVVDYGTEAFRKGYEVWRSFGPGPKLNHVLCGMGSGHSSANSCIAQDTPWVEHADFVEFDCYNYMYPHWRPVGQLRWNEFHYLAGHFRFQTLRTGQLLGFFIQVTDRDVPVAPWDPLRAPSETLYTAIGQGAKTFHLMAKYPFINTQNCREEKFDTFAADVRKVRRVAPLLERTQSPRSRIAMTFPFHDRLYRMPEHRLPPGYRGMGYYTSEYRPFDDLWPYHPGPFNVAELLVRAFGETDVIDQTTFHTGSLDDCRAFVLNGTDYIADEDAQAVVKFVDQGGVLICDHIPSHNTNGDTIDALTPLFGGQAEPFYKDIAITHSRFGQGRTMLFSDDLNEIYTGSIEQNEPVLRYRLKDTLRRYLFDAGIKPHAFSSNYEIEAATLLTDDTIVLVCISHAEDRHASHITLFDPDVPATGAVDLVTMQPYAIERTEQGIELDIDLDEREGLILGLYCQVPTQSSIQLSQDTIRRGQNLSFRVMLADAAGNAVRGDHIVDVRVTDSQGDERRQFGGLLCAANGELLIDHPIAVNARTGTWTISAFDRFTSHQVSAQFTVTA